MGTIAGAAFKRAPLDVKEIPYKPMCLAIALQTTRLSNHYVERFEVVAS